MYIFKKQYLQFLQFRQTALHWAVKRNELEITKFLIERNADFYCKDAL